MNGFDRVSTISNEMMRLLLDKGIRDEKSIFFPNWVDTKEIKPIITNSVNVVIENQYRIKFNLPIDSVVLLYSGNIGEKQGIDIVIESARKLQSMTKIKFIICGAGSGYAKLKNLAEGLPNILWLPLQPKRHLNELLNMADIHLLPQIATYADLVMPSKLLGIFASGRPVIACAEKGSALYEVVDNNGINVKLGNALDFHDAIVNLCQNKKLREILGGNARKYALLHFEKEKILRSFEANLMILYND
jgi:colanic acid biosynthesis glycosyl transferase WcaI